MNNSPKIENISIQADNRNPVTKPWYEWVTIIIDSLSDLLHKNKRLSYIALLAWTGILTKDNVVRFFEAIKWLTVTLWFWW